MPESRERIFGPRRLAVVLLAFVTPAYVLAPACSPEAPKNPSYVRIELVAAAKPVASAVRVVISSKGQTIAALCLDVEGPAEQTAASFVVKREADEDPSARIDIAVTPFSSLSGIENAAPGKEFACPEPLPPAAGPTQEVSVGFCASEAKSLVIHVDARCCEPVDGGASDGGNADGADGADSTGGTGGADAASDAGDAGTAADTGAEEAGAPDGGDAGSGCCNEDEVCGAGLSYEGHACYADHCCPRVVSDACALDSAK